MYVNEYTSRILNYERRSLESLYRVLVKGFRDYSSDSVEQLDKAFELGKKVHEKHFRDSGVPYMTHPIIVAILLLPYRVDLTTLVAALLHDVVEDSLDPGIKDHIREMFGEDVLNLIDGVSKVVSEAKDVEKNSEDTIRKILRYAEKDVRILLIKLSDRLHNMITLGTKRNLRKRQKKAHETLDVFVPIARRLGLWGFYQQLEVNCFSHLAANDFKKIKEEMNRYRGEAKDVFAKIKDGLLGKFGREYRLKIEQCFYTIVSLFHYVYARGELSPCNIFYVKVVTDSKESCYKLLSELGALYPRKSDRFYDYIANPKDNDYQAIHATFVIDGMYLVRFHIVSHEMDGYNLKGVTLNMGEGCWGLRFLEDLKIIDEATSDRTGSFLKAIRSDILEEKITVHYGQGRTMNVPKNASALDAVFSIFPEKALYTNEILINNKTAPFSQQLVNNDILSVEFDPDYSAGVDWMAYLQTEGARIVLQDFLKQQSRNQKVLIGEQLLQAELDRYGKGEINHYFHLNKGVLPALKVDNIEEVCMLIAEGLLTPVEVIYAEKGIKKSGVKRNWFEKLVTWLFPKHFGAAARLRLRIVGHDTDGNENFYDSLFQLYKRFSLIPERILIKQRGDRGFCAYSTVRANDERDLDSFFLAIQNMKMVSKVSPLIPRVILLELMMVAVISGFAWFLFILGLLQMINDGVHSLLTYLVIVPVLFGNLVTYRFVANYFPLARNSRWFVGLVFALNSLAVALYGSAVLIYQLDFFHWSLFFPLTILVISTIAVIMVFIRKQHLYHMYAELRPLQTHEWGKLKKKKIIGYFIRFGAVVIWGLEPLYIKYTVTNSIDPGVRIFLKAIGGLIPSLLVGFFVFRLVMKKKLTTKLPYNKLFAVIIVGEMLFTYLMNSSLIYTSSTNVILLNNFAPVFALVVAALLWRDKISYMKKTSHLVMIMATFIVGSLGSTLLFYNDVRFADSSNVYGDFLATLNMVTDVFLVIAMIKYVQSLRVSQSVTLNFNIFLFSLVASAPLAFLSAGGVLTLSWEQILFGIGAGVLSGFGRILNFEAFRLIDGFLAFLMFNISIFVTFVIEAFIIDAIPATALLVLSGLMIVGASTFAEYMNSKCEKQGL